MGDTTALSNDHGTLFVNGRFFRPSASSTGLDAKAVFSECMLVRDGVIQYVGATDDEAVAQEKHGGVVVRDLGGNVVLPGFIDGHMHLMFMGLNLSKLSLQGCASLADIQARITAYARAHPDAPRILCSDWMFAMLDGAPATAAMLDGLDGVGDRPVFVDEKSLHATWCNSAALAELGVASMADPPGGRIERDAEGRATGLLTEAMVLLHTMPYLARTAGTDAKVGALAAAVRAYSAAGYTGMVELAMDGGAWEALLELRRREPDLPMRVAAYWLVAPKATEADNLAQVDAAAAMARAYNADSSPDCRVVGIKVVCDGIVDACTATLREPYADGSAAAAEQTWTAATLGPVVARADAAGLQIALHAIGDATAGLALDALERRTANTARKRHRIEHLELTTAADAARLGRLGVTASVQPVHADPAILRAWPRLLGARRCARAFAYREFADGGAPLAVGSDAPTAPHHPLRNLYVGATRRSAREPGRPPREGDVRNEQFRLGLCEAAAAATRGAAYSVFADHRVGVLEPGRMADFAVVEMEWEAEKLLEATVRETWFAGRRVYEAGA